jgi:lipopolysaccharide export LptBFGC system permease protein LptF
VGAGRKRNLKFVSMFNKKFIIIAIIILVAIVVVFWLWPQGEEQDDNTINISLPELSANADSLSKDDLRALYEESNVDNNMTEDELQKAQELYGEVKDTKASSTPKEFEPSEDVCKMFSQVPDCSGVPSVIMGICVKCKAK